MTHIILFGRPGAGKSTIGGLLAERRGFVHLPLGKMLKDPAVLAEIGIDPDEMRAAIASGRTATSGRLYPWLDERIRATPDVVVGGCPRAERPATTGVSGEWVRQRRKAIDASGLRGASSLIDHLRLSSLPLLAVLAGCVAGPNYVRPADPVSGGFVAGPEPARTVATVGPGGAGQVFRPGEELPRGWWHWFGSPQITALVERGYAASPTLAAARARLRGAEAQLRATRGLLAPFVGASASASLGNGGGQGRGTGGIQSFNGSGNQAGGTTGTGGAGSGGGTGTGGTGTGGTGTGGTGTGEGTGTGGGTGTDNTDGTGSDDNGGFNGNNGGVFTVYTASASVSYDLDLAGRRRRLIEAASAERDRQGQEVQAAYLALTGNIVSTALQSASLREQIAAREELVAGQNDRINLLRVRVEEGADARADLVATLADVAALRATIPPLRAQLAASDNRLALLTGAEPQTAPVPPIRLNDLRLPRMVPISLPSRLVRTRPDILAAEAVLARTSAQIGVEAADLYPQVTLDAGFGIVGGASGLGLGSPSPFFDLGGGLFAPLFDGGTRRAERDVAVALYQEALALYRERVLTAFVQVANGIRALENDALALADRRTALEAAGESLDLARFRLTEGAISVIDVLVVQQRYEQARIAYIQAIAARFQDTAALFAALGPGPLTDEDLSGIAAREALDYTRNRLNAGRQPDEGL